MFVQTIQSIIRACRISADRSPISKGYGRPVKKTQFGAEQKKARERFCGTKMCAKIQQLHNKTQLARRSTALHLTAEKLKD
jgi:hypothetical protein